jgi:NAD(P)-dependent dehydrogenase (short-subunit alcohol dehydrogenase family)
LDLGLKDRVAIVTGASKGIGLAIAQGLVAEGARVIAGARTSSAELDALAEDGEVQVLQLDLADPQGPERLVSLAGDRIDILVNNVGIAPPRLTGFESITDEQWFTTWNLNLMAAVRATRHVLPSMVAAGKGVIVSTCSVNATLPDPAVMDYSAAKAGLLSFSKSLSKEFGPKGVRVNTVSPGPVATALWLGEGGVAAQVADATGASPEDVARQAASDSVTGRFTQPEEVADLVLFLASDRADNITGTDFRIDGGLITTL